MKMKKLIEEIDIQTEIMKELLQVLERETAEMGDINIIAMNLSNQTKEELIARIAEHTPHLQKAVSVFAVDRGLSESTTLGVVAKHVAKNGNQQLLAKQQQILSTAELVQQVSTLNKEIAERFASSITSSLGLITRLVNQSNIYGSSGGYQQRPAGAVMVNREA